MYQQSDIHHQAERRVRSKSKFYKHLFVYLVVNGFFTVVALLDGEGTAPLIMAFSWGIGLAFHYLRVFGFPGNGVLSHAWEDKQYQRELERLARKQRSPKMAEEQLDLKVMAKSYRDSDLV